MTIYKTSLENRPEINSYYTFHDASIYILAPVAVHYPFMIILMQKQNPTECGRRNITEAVLSS